MQQRTSRVSLISQWTVCLLGLMTYVFYPGLHKLEHVYRDKVNADERLVIEFDDYSRNCEVSEAGTACPGNNCSIPVDHQDRNHSHCGSGVTRECSLCQGLYLLSINSLSMPFPQITVRLTPFETQTSTLFFYSESWRTFTKQARAPPVPFVSSLPPSLI